MTEEDACKWPACRCGLLGDCNKPLPERLSPEGQKILRDVLDVMKPKS